MIARSKQFTSPQRNRGAVLFVALVFLVLITLLGLIASSTSVLQERMTGGMRNAQLGLMGAESAMRGVEFNIWNAANTTGTTSKLNCGFNGLDNNCYAPQSIAGTGGATVFQMSSKVESFRTSSGWLDASTDGAAAYATQPLNVVGTGTTGVPRTASLANQPRYLIEYLGKVLPPGAPTNLNGGAIDGGGGHVPGSVTLYAYRISARSTGGNDGSVRATESFFIALPPNN